jgi:glutamine synthetase
VRVPNERGAAARLESRLADGSASAYLASAIHIFAGVDGVERGLDPGPATERVYEPPIERATVPFSLGEALDVLGADSFVRRALGEQFMQAFLTIKRNEWRRFQLAVTDWELREYADAL